MYVGGTVQEPGHYASVRGMERAAEKISQAAAEIAESGMHSAQRNSAAVDAAGRVDAGPAVVNDFEGSMLDLSMGDTTYRANLRSARASDAQFAQMMDMAIPQGYSRLVDESVV